MREPIEVRKLAHAARVNVDSDGNPMCRCCAEAMVEVKPGTWMCAVGAAALAYLKLHCEPQLDARILGGPSESDHG